MNIRFVFAVFLIGLICTSTIVEGRFKLHRAFKRVGHALEKVGKKALEDGTVSKILLARAIGRKKRFADDVIPKNVEHPWSRPIPYTR